MNHEAGVARMSRLEKSFNSRMIQWRENVLPLRASFGLSVYAGTDTPEEIMRAADLRLYAHKAKRRANAN
jgi:GGDEF domain-containing protein